MLSHDMRALIDFFNHGMLPYVGREKEFERLMDFWRGTSEAQGLRAALVLAEAGAGKSRMIEEIAPRVVAAGGMMVQVKLYPGGTTAIAPLIAQAMWFSSTGRQLLKKEPEGILPSVVMALGRIARLRPTLLVIEDIHLLNGESLREFASLLEGLADETLSVLCMARPVELKGRGVLERYLVEEIRLPALGKEEIEGLWRTLFDTEPDAIVIDALMGATMGNALALRSALRGLLKSGGLARNPAGPGWELVLSGTLLVEALERNVRFLSEGMAAYLTEEEHLQARQLAALGEVFSREGGRTMIADSDRAIEVLTFKGIIAPSSPATPIAGHPGDSPPLAFTHTLLHRHLLDQAVVDIGTLVQAIASAVPLYSILPFQTIAERDLPVDGDDLDAEKVDLAIEHALAAAIALDRTPDWEMAQQPLNAALALADIGSDRRSAQEGGRLAIQLTGARLELSKRADHTGEFQQLLEEFLSLTSGDLPEELLGHRLAALSYLFRRERRVDLEKCRQIWSEVEELVGRYPSLPYTRAFMVFLQTASLATNTRSDSEMIPRAQRWFHRIVASRDLPAELRQFAYREVAPNFLAQFSTPEELQERMKFLAEIEAYSGEDDLMVKTRKLAFLEGLGHAHEALQLIDDVIPRLKERGQVRHIVQCSLLRLSALAWFDLTLEEVEAQADRLCNEAPEEIRTALRDRLGVRLARIGLLRNAPLWARHIIDRFLESETDLWTKERLLLAVAEGRAESFLRQLGDYSFGDDPQEEGVTLLAHRMVGTEPLSVDDAESVRRGLHDSLVTRDGLLGGFLMIDLLEKLGERPEENGIIASLRPDVHDLVVAMLEWLDTRQVFGYMGPVLEKYGGYLGDREKSAWRRRTESLAEAYRAAERAAQADLRLRVSMLGTIQAHLPGGEVNQLRGIRLRTLLGLLVIDQITDKPFSYREFCRLAASGEEDQDRARKVMNMGVLRLREAIGTEAIRTDTESPRLNTDYVRVDLLDAHRLLRESALAAREGALMRGVPPLIAALDLVDGQVPFPGLYDDLFEAAREDFEFSIRAAVIDVSRGLLREGDVVNAEEVLRRGFDAMPDDEEIAELLRETLVKLGKRIEAERVKIRAAEALAD